MLYPVYNISILEVCRNWHCEMPQKQRK